MPEQQRVTKPAPHEHVAPKVHPAPPIQTQPLTSVQLATAFDGKLERTPLAVGYHVGVLLVACAMVLLPLAYLAMIAITIWVVGWHATHSASMFRYVRGGYVMLFMGAVYVAPIIAGFLLVLFMILPLFWRSDKRVRPFWVDRREQPLLYAYIDQLCDAMRVPRPARIDLIASPNASARIDNGLRGLISRRLVLTIGLPLPLAMDLRQFTGVIAHELGHFSQGSSMRLSYVIHAINGWFMRMAYTRSGIDDALDSLVGDEPHWTIALISLVSKLALGLARLVLKVLAIISHCLSMHLSRQAEFDADRKAARIVGSEAVGDALQALPLIDVAGSLALERAQAGWQARALPDDLVLLTDRVGRHLPPTVKQKVDAELLAQDASWFDTHPPLFKRVGALKRANFKGTLKFNAPATALFKEFDELCKFATLDLYHTVLGPKLRPEHLVPTVAPVAAQKPASTARPLVDSPRSSQSAQRNA